MLNPVIRWEPGTLVRYHGSLTDLHGMYAAHPCDCLNCGDIGLGAARFQLVNEQGAVTVRCVRPGSITPEDEDGEGAHEECLGIHTGADGYRDCDGNPV
jgi:hypothetical protein